MEPDKKICNKMRELINIIALFALFVQSISCVLNCLTMPKPTTRGEFWYQYFIFTSYLCSCIVVFVFFLIYNTNNCVVKNRIINILFLILVILATYVHISQLFVLHDFILTSIVLLLIDGYVVYRIWKNYKRSRV